jgi:TolA-binding protein
VSSTPIRILVFVALTALAFGQGSGRASDDYAFAAGLHDRGLHERAVKAFRNYLKEHPRGDDRPRAHFYLGQSLVELGQDAEALEAFDAHLASREGDLRALSLLRSGELLLRLERPARAAKRLATLIDEGGDADSLEAAHYFLGEACLSAGQPEKGVSAFQTLLKRWPESRYRAWAQLGLGYRSLSQGEAKEARERFLRAAKAASDEELRIEARAMAAEAALEREQFTIALREFASLEVDERAELGRQVSLGRARARLGLGKVEEALASFRDHVAKYPSDRRAHRALIRGAAKLHENKRGRDGLAFLKLVQGAEGQDAEDLAYWSGRLLDAGGDTAAALVELKAAAARSPRRKFAYGDALSRAGRYEEALGVFRELDGEAKEPLLRAEAAFARAYALNRLDRHEEALQLLKALAEFELPADLRRDVLFAAGENAFAAKRLRDAGEWYDRLLSLGLGKHRSEALYKRGWTAWLAKEYGAAREAFARLLKEAPTSPFRSEALYLTGKCQEAAGDHDGAQRTFAKLAQESRETPEAAGLAAKARLGEAAAALKTGRPDLARAAFAAAAETAVEPGLRAEALAGLARSDFDAGRHEEALKVQERFLRDHADHPRRDELRLERAWTLRALGRREEAAEAARTVIETQDAMRRGEAHYLCGLCLHEMGRDADAVLPLRPLLSMNDHPRRAEAELLLGVSLARSGQDKEAQALLAKATAGSELSGRPTALYELAFCRDRLGAFAERDAAFLTIVTEHAQDTLAADAGFRLGESRYAADQFETALRAYDFAAQHASLGDLADEVGYKRAWCLRQLKRFAEAAKAFEATAQIEGSPLAAEAAFLAGDACERAGQDAEAATHFARFAAAHQNHEYAADAACRAILARARLEEWDRVRRAAPAVLERFPKAERGLAVRSALADAYFAKKSWERARTAYRLVIAASEGPLAARAQCRIGASWRAAGRDDRAIDEYLKVPILYAHAAWAAKASAAAADLLEAKGEGKKAARLREDLIRDYPDTDEAKRLRGRADGAPAPSRGAEERGD